MARTLQGRRVILTGATGGVGRCLTEQAARAGARLLLVARTADRLEELARSAPGEAVAVAADLTVAADRERVVRTARERFGGLDVLINNAGVNAFGQFAESSEALLRQVMEVNFFGPTELIRLALPLLREGTAPAIVNVSSVTGRRGLPAFPEYAASKFALSGLTEALRAEFVRFGIDVLLIVPGRIRGESTTRWLRNEGRAQIDYTRGIAPEDVAAGILRALARGRPESVLGWDARWLLRVNRLFPWLVNALIARKVRKLYPESAGAPAPAER